MNSHRAKRRQERPPTRPARGFFFVTSVALASFLTLVLLPPHLAVHSVLACTGATCSADAPRPAHVWPAANERDDGSTSAPRPWVWAEAFSVVARLADSGSAAASRLALEMHRHGPTVYGASFGASDQQLRRWRRQTVCGAPPCIAQT